MNIKYGFAFSLPHWAISNRKGIKKKKKLNQGDENVIRHASEPMSHPDSLLATRSFELWVMPRPNLIAIFSKTNASFKKYSAISISEKSHSKSTHSITLRLDLMHWGANSGFRHLGITEELRYTRRGHLGGSLAWTVKACKKKNNTDHASRKQCARTYLSCMN